LLFSLSSTCHSAQEIYETVQLYYYSDKYMYFVHNMLSPFCQPCFLPHPIVQGAAMFGAATSMVAGAYRSPMSWAVRTYARDFPLALNMSGRFFFWYLSRGMFPP
jgi:hypothetical protein